MLINKECLMIKVYSIYPQSDNCFFNNKLNNSQRNI